jgi:hypothetical protein
MLFLVVSSDVVVPNNKTLPANAAMVMANIASTMVKADVLRRRLAMDRQFMGV